MAENGSGVVTDWNGYRRRDFIFEGWDAILVEPTAAALAKWDGAQPWIWRARFFDAWPAVDRAVLERGFHVAYVDVADLFGGPEAVDRFDAYYEYLTAEQGLSRRPVLEGFSRGGLIIYSWAAANADKVCCLYGDAPVCDIRSWPGGLGVGVGNAECWPRCLAAHGLSEADVEGFRGNPIDRLEPLAAAGIPVIHVCGDADDAVPQVENTDVLAARYRALGGRIEVIVKPGVGHHPHSLEDPTPVVDFILAAWRERGEAPV